MKKVEKKIIMKQVRNHGCKKLWRLSVLSGFLIGYGLYGLQDAIGTGRIILVNSMIAYLLFAVVHAYLTRSVAVHRDKYQKIIEMNVSERQIEDAYAAVEDE